jgi:tRNA 2-thiouridine synthesizing protein B
MSELHTVNKSPFEKSSFDSCLGHVLDGSAVLLYEDGVYAAVKGTAMEGKVKSAQGVKFYVLGPDMKARGLGAERLTDGIEIVDYAGFVDLATEHEKVVAWV